MDQYWGQYLPHTTIHLPNWKATKTSCQWTVCLLYPSIRVSLERHEKDSNKLCNNVVLYFWFQRKSHWFSIYAWESSGCIPEFLNFTCRESNPGGSLGPTVYYMVGSDTLKQQNILWETLIKILLLFIMFGRQIINYIMATASNQYLGRTIPK